jgi:hypothetical protein
VGPLDEAGNIRSDETLPADVNDAKVRLKRREGIGPDPRPGGRHCCQKGGLAGIGQAHEADVRQELEVQPHHNLFAQLAALGDSRGAVHGRRESRIAPATHPSARRDDRGAFLRQVGDKLVTSVFADSGNLRSYWYPENKVRGATPCLVGALPMRASLGPVNAPASQFLECADGPVSDDDDVAALTAISTVWPPPGHELLAAEADDAVSAISTFQRQLELVYHSVIIRRALINTASQ